ncbi:hypothetical protein [Phenylobacterium kunshanense]|uniref:Chemotaxis protein CheE n=1 Tax=Phenylobacterium kunshanense TaxID=1445034 RepID=A0A328BCZ8_9CAUL|nr:hypothetical protein [Phenylobacterium kunshanense]RAK65380.1 hypothetical protein DJ019_10425 [Phenylobacterium kunshanense]
MSAVIYTRAPNRLGKLLSQPGGKRRDQAIADSEAALEKIRPELLAEIDGALAQLGDLVGRAAKELEVRPEVYTQARTIVGFAGLCEKQALGTVAFSLCDLCDHYIEAGVWNATAVEAHLKTMIVFRTAPWSETSPEASAVLEGLREIVRRAEEQAAKAAG